MAEPNVRFTVTRPDGSPHDLVAVIYPAEGRAPLAIFLHGIPGSVKNHDIATRLQANGWHALVLHFSGAWGSGGAYNILEHPADASGALDFALDQLEVQEEKIALIGFSLGSRAAILSAAQDTRVGAVISISGFCDFEDVMLAPEFWEEASPLLASSTPDSLRKQFIDLGEGIQPWEAAQHISPRPVLVIHGTEDETVPYFHSDCFVNMSGPHIRHSTIEGANHTFDDHRDVLIASVEEFLSDWEKTP